MWDTDMPSPAPLPSCPHCTPNTPLSVHPGRSGASSVLGRTPAPESPGSHLCRLGAGVSGSSSHLCPCQVPSSTLRSQEGPSENTHRGPLLLAHSLSVYLASESPDPHPPSMGSVRPGGVASLSPPCPAPHTVEAWGPAWGVLGGRMQSSTQQRARRPECLDWTGQCRQDPSRWASPEQALS